MSFPTIGLDCASSQIPLMGGKDEVHWTEERDTEDEWCEEEETTVDWTLEGAVMDKCGSGAWATSSIDCTCLLSNSSVLGCFSESMSASVERERFLDELNSSPNTSTLIAPELLLMPRQ